MAKKWTEEEVDILRKCEGSTIAEIQKLLPDRNINQIRSKCKYENINYKRNGWVEYEIEILLDCNGLTIHEILEKLPHRNKHEIYAKAREMGVKLASAINLWSDEEDNILRQHAYINSSFEDMQKIIPHRSIKSIKSRFATLNLQIRSIDYSPVGKTKEYRKNHSKSYRYFDIYGIKLDKDKMIDTYDIIQWWKWLHYGTPSGNELKMLPLDFYKKPDELLKLMRYVIENEIGFKTRDDLLDLSIKLLIKYKIHFKHQFPKSLLDIINMLYPSYKIKGFELSNAPLNYWENKSNCDEYMKHVLLNEFNVLNLDNIKRDLPMLLTYQSIREMGYGGLAYCITECHHYDSFYSWVNNLFPEWDLDISDFREQISYDNNILDSNEEVVLYNYLKRDLGIPIESIPLKTKKYRFYNETYNENYIPDFIIHTNDKNIIIEYFGLYVEGSKNSKILKTYHSKTKRKVSFFNNLKMYDFIDLYPEDLKNDFEGVRNKLTPFIM